jgi:hypothetical protein
VNTNDRSQIAREVDEAGRCSYPVRLRSTQVNSLTGEFTSRIIKVACKDRREIVCAACSRTYGTDAWIVAATGLNGGKGVSPDVVECPRLFVTMTAPGFGAVHTIRSSGGCVRPASASRSCEHGVPRSCGLHHGLGDRLLGLPICAECFRYRDAVLWNAHASRLWSATVLQTRRNLAVRLGVRRTDVSRQAATHYLKVAEMQRRGLIHFHALVRLESARGAPTELHVEELIGAWVDATHNVVITNELGQFEWGNIIDIQTVGKQNEDARVVASYLAKYVTKTAGDGLELARRFHSRRQIGTLVDNPHLRHLALEAWDLDADPLCAHLSTRRHANTLGYVGQIMTKSRHYSTTLTALREARRAYRVHSASNQILAGGYSYEGRGYDDPQAAILAELFTGIERERRDVSRKVTGDE